MKEPINKVHVNCNNCGADDTEFVSHGQEHEYENTTDEVFNVVRCRQCGLCYLNPRPDVSALSIIYPAEYYAYHLHRENIEQEKQGSWLYQARKFVYLSKLMKSLELCPKSPQLNVLDIGCADGRALDWYRKIDKYQIATYGVDFDQQAVKRAADSGHQVFVGRFEDADIPDNMFDLVVATHVIEHVANPREFALKAFRVLKPGGIFLCETPNIDSVDARWFAKQHWGGYHFPRHWVFYSPQSITALAETIGFKLLKIEFYPGPAFWNWTFHSLLSRRQSAQGNCGRRSRLADYLFPPVDFQKNNFRNFCAASLFTVFDLVIKFATGRTSNMSVILQRPQT